MNYNTRTHILIFFFFFSSKNVKQLRPRPFFQLIRLLGAGGMQLAYEMYELINDVKLGRCCFTRCHVNKVDLHKEIKS